MGSIWLDGLGRRTVKAQTGAAKRGDMLTLPDGRVGLCRALGWVQVYGPAAVGVDATPEDLARWLEEGRRRMAERARRSRLPWYLRYNPWRDPRVLAILSDEDSTTS